MDIITIAERVASLGGAALLVIALIGVLRGWWVPRWMFDQETKRVDYWKELYNRERVYNDNARKGEARTRRGRPEPEEEGTP